MSSTPTTAQAQAIAAKLQKHLTSRSSKTLPYSVMDLGDIKDVLAFILQQQKRIEELVETREFAREGECNALKRIEALEGLYTSACDEVTRLERHDAEINRILKDALDRHGIKP
jgi:hypothetical protein